MEIRVLKYFLAVAQNESIVKAADVLNITQPTLSRQIMELEKELKTKLFFRGKRNTKITLTDDGKLLYRRANELVELFNKTEAEFKFENENISGEIYIGGGETSAISYIAKTINSLSILYPNIKFHFYSGNGEDVSEKLDKGILDFGLFIEPFDKKDYDFIELPQKDLWGLLVKKNDFFNNKLYIEPSDLVDLPLISSRQFLVKNLLSGWLGYNYEKLNIVGTYNLLYNASILVKEGFGNALCINDIINTKGTDLLFIPLKPELKVGVIFAWKKNRSLSKCNKIFLSEFQKNLSAGL